MFKNLMALHYFLSKQQMRGIQNVRVICFLYSTKGTQEEICHFTMQSPRFSTHLLLQSKTSWCHLWRMFTAACTTSL